MADVKSLDQFFKSLNEYGRRAVPRIIAEKATEHFKRRFTTKEWDGTPWPQTKQIIRRGSILVRSGKLVNSIRPKTVNIERVAISAGSSKVPYAKAHNEGETITIPVTDKMRRFAWAMYYNEAGSGVRTNKAGATYQSVGVGKKANPWKGLALTQKKTLTVKLPKRQFMGKSNALNKEILESLSKEFQTLF